MHLKYRPKTWEEVIGNDIIKKSIRSLNYTRPILLKGDKGCGKTTIAYLIANEFGAPKENITDYNCGVDTSINSIRDELTKLFHPTIFGNKSVLILDEIHLLSQPAKKALLKDLESEDLPTHSLIICCTTNPELIPGPLYDRFLDYKVQRLSDTESVMLIKKVSQAEGIEVKKSVLPLLIEKCEGIPRRLLTGLAKIKDVHDEQEIIYLLESQAIGEDVEILELFKFILSKRPWASVKSLLNNVLKDKSPDAVRVGLMNIISGNVMSSYFNEGNRNFLLSLYDSLLHAQGYPEKANLIMALLKNS